MPKSTVSDWDTSAANNTDVGGANIGEGCAPSGINNAIRNVMSQVATQNEAKRAPEVADTAAYNRMISNARYGDPLRVIDLLTRTQAEGVQEHTITDDLAPTLQTLLVDDRAINVRLPNGGLIPIGSTIPFPESQFTSNGIHFGSTNMGWHRAVGGKTNCIIQKTSSWAGGYAIDVNAAGTTAMQTAHFQGFHVDGNGQAGGGVRMRYMQDVLGNFSVEDDDGYGILLDGVWNSNFLYLMAKDTGAGGIVLDPVTRENSNLDFITPWVAKCGGVGELALLDDASNTNGTIRFYNLLAEATKRTGAADSDGMVVVENGKRVTFVAPQITSPDGRDAHCVVVGKVSRVGDLENIKFVSPNFNNTGTKTRENCIRMRDVPAGTVTMTDATKKGNNAFAGSNAATELGALKLIGSNVITNASDLTDLSADGDMIVSGEGNGDIGVKGGSGSDYRVVSTDQGRPVEIGGTDNTGTEKTVSIAPNAGTFDLNDLQIILANTVAPSSASDTGSTGEIRWAGNFIYVCTAANTWKRVSIATW